MRICIKNQLLFPALITAFVWVLTGESSAQTFKVLHAFTGSNLSSPNTQGTNTDGAGPRASLILYGKTLYGTTLFGGSGGNGTVFGLNTDGSGFTVLHGFTTGSGPYPNITNSDGAFPRASLILSGTTLYGTTQFGGSAASGTVFAVNSDGTGFTTLYSFTATSCYDCPNSDGAVPFAGLILSGNLLYGTATRGGSEANGTVFALNTDGTGFTTLYSFTRQNCFSNCTNSDGGVPQAALVLSSNALYATTPLDGPFGEGAVFAVNADGTGFTVLHSFLPSPSDGASPRAALVLSGNTLYGTTAVGGNNGKGTVFRLNTDGTGFSILHNFNGGSDGDGPFSALVLSGNTLYGTTSGGGTHDSGTIFAINTDGTGFATLYTFTGGSDGASPYGGLVLSGNSLYGTTSGGGTSDNGTIFSISLLPQLTLTPSGTNGILTWPTSYAGFDYGGYTLQSTTNVASPEIWTPVSARPTVVNGQHTVTNPILGTQQFYRLAQ